MHESIERSIVIRARISTVWRFFSDSEAFARWWGEGSTIAAQVGGAVKIRYPGGSAVSGEVLAIEPPHAIVFTYGYDDPGKPLRPGESTVHVKLSEHPLGTLVELRHELPSRELANMHVPGWRYQLSVFAKLVHAQQHEDRDAIVDAWFSAWNASDAATRSEALERAVTDDVAFADEFAYLRGRDELLGQLAALGIHMPGVTLARVGKLRYAQGTALCDFAARRGEQQVMSGTNVFEFGSDGRIARVTGIPG
jgi:uncharacterized protein YndB with AHSA1/START domain